MEAWQWTAILLCGFGFAKELRPSEQFVTEYLMDYKNFTSDTIVQVAYPISTYTYLGALPFVFLVTDFVRYRSIIVLEGVAFVGTYALLIWGEGLLSLKILEVLYGIAGACDVAYYTYIYAKVDKEHYKKVTSYTYSAIFIGNLVAAVLSQALVSTHAMDYYSLNFISLGGVGAALVLSLFLPPVRESVYFYRNEGSGSALTGGRKSPRLDERARQAYRVLWKDFKGAYSNSYILKWSIWWAAAAAGHLQVSNYIQSLWEVISPDAENESWNGAVGAIQCALSAALALTVGHVKLPWNKWGESFLSLISILQGLALIWMSQTNDLYTSYVLYIVFRTLYQVMITVASAEVAQGISEDSYGLVFGLNTFLAVSIQTVLTVTVTDESGLALSERAQFLVYGGYHVVLGIVFIFVAGITFARYGCSARPSSMLEEEVLAIGPAEGIPSATTAGT